MADSGQHISLAVTVTPNQKRFASMSPSREMNVEGYVGRLISNKGAYVIQGNLRLRVPARQELDRETSVRELRAP